VNDLPTFNTRLSGQEGIHALRFLEGIKCDAPERVCNEAVAPTYIPRSHTESIPLKIISNRPAGTSPLTTQSGDSPTSRASRTVTPTKEDNSTVEKVENDTHSRHQACFPTRHVVEDRKDHSKIRLSMQRVYKKPRQKVRWTCEICQTAFTTSHTCRTCEHRKCTSCTRNP
jgi:hypothetical protein